jgi:transcriptional regulator with XRE-family HTH domain
VATALKVVRTVRNLRRQDVAALAGISRTTVARIEAGRHQPQTATAVKLADALGVPVGLLLERVPPTSTRTPGAR